MEGSMELPAPLWDYIFGILFGDQRHIDILAGFLRTLLDLPQNEYAHLTIVNPMLKRMWKRDKSAVVDVRVKTKSGRVIHVEMQMEHSAQMKNRILYYSSKLLWEQMKRGYEYSRINQVISIIICDHILVPEENEYLNTYEIRHEGSGERFTDLVKIIILELPKVPKDENGKPEWPWLEFFKCRTLEEFDMLAKRHPEVKKAVTEIKKLSWTKRYRMYIEDRNLARYDRQIIDEERREEAWNNGRQEGLQKGLEEGRTEGLQEGCTEGLQKGLEEASRAIARNLKARGRPMDEIAAVTGLSPEEIEKQ
jgi:predicted transposase/invertase (TIGR01784 family)